jgi:hypothetical protein
VEAAAKYFKKVLAKSVRSIFSLGSIYTPIIDALPFLISCIYGCGSKTADHTSRYSG